MAILGFILSLAVYLAFVYVGVFAIYLSVSGLVDVWRDEVKRIPDIVAVIFLFTVGILLGITGAINISTLISEVM